ncbi:hypothetical protein [Roseivirga seohaensis]|uniref:hypothetical protein n=1 Tax=Roseivirga seohaensis TaxID=1914963 RepID=UPI003BAD0FDC
MSNPLFEKGEHVIMHTCLESEKHPNKVWVCKTDSFKANSGHEVVFLEGYSGYFLCVFLHRSADPKERIEKEILTAMSCIDRMQELVQSLPEEENEQYNVFVSNNIDMKQKFKYFLNRYFDKLARSRKIEA